MKQLTSERILGVITALVGLGAMLHAVQLGFHLNDEDMGVGLFPLIVGCCLMLCGMYHVLSAGRLTQSYQQLRSEQMQMLAKVFAGLVVYISIMELVGYLIATFIFVTYLTKILGAENWKKAILLAAFTAFAFSLIFQMWMQMPLPIGIFALQEVF